MSAAAAPARIPAAIESATAEQPAAALALAAAVADPFHAYLLVGPSGRRQARRRPRARRRAARRRRARPRRGPPPCARRSLSAPGPGLAAPAGDPAPGRGGPRASDRAGALPAVRGRAAGVRDRGRRRDGRGEPERAPEDARGATPVRAPDPDQRRARGVAGDGSLALPTGRLLAARPRRGRGPTRPRSRSRRAPRGRAARRRRPRPGGVPARRAGQGAAGRGRGARRRRALGRARRCAVGHAG